jgi:LysR family hydrogen peroxide-inducible transcriptional activator
VQFHQLRYFCAEAKTGSFTRGADHAYVTQSSLSQQIRKLEDEPGARLFDRLGRSVRLTQLGEVFLPRAESILRQVAAAKLEIQEMRASRTKKSGPAV